MCVATRHDLGMAETHRSKGDGEGVLLGYHFHWWRLARATRGVARRGAVTVSRRVEIKTLWSTAEHPSSTKAVAL